MPLFSRLYDKVIRWSRHRHASYYLCGLSFAESSFFPIPPDVMLAPMALANPKKAWWYAALTTIFSVLGGIAGYLLGMFAFEMVAPVLVKAGYCGGYIRVQEWFAVWGFVAILAAGFTPIPYKIFTIASGAIPVAFPLFVIGSVIGRGLRFFMVAGLMYWGGKKMEDKLRLYIDRLGWAVIALLVVAFLAFKLLPGFTTDGNGKTRAADIPESVQCEKMLRKPALPSGTMP